MHLWIHSRKKKQKLKVNSSIKSLVISSSSFISKPTKRKLPLPQKWETYTYKWSGLQQEIIQQTIGKIWVLWAKLSVHISCHMHTNCHKGERLVCYIRHAELFRRQCMYSSSTVVFRIPGRQIRILSLFYYAYIYVIPLLLMLMKCFLSVFPIAP